MLFKVLRALTQGKYCNILLGVRVFIPYRRSKLDATLLNQRRDMACCSCDEVSLADEQNDRNDVVKDTEHDCRMLAGHRSTWTGPPYNSLCVPIKLLFTTRDRVPQLFWK